MGARRIRLKERMLKIFSVRDWAARTIRTSRARERGIFIGKRKHFLDLSKVDSIGRVFFPDRYTTTRDRWEYESQLALKKKGYTIRGLMEKRIERKASVSVLDVGSGFGVFLNDLMLDFAEGKKRPRIETGSGIGDRSREVRGRVKATGLVVAKPFDAGEINRLRGELLEAYSKTHPEVKDWHQMPLKFQAQLEVLETEGVIAREREKKNELDVRVGLAETYQFGKKFDLIFSHWAFDYMVDSGKAFRNVLEHLAPGGEAFISFSANETVVLKNRVWLAKQGIGIKKLGRKNNRNCFRFYRKFN